MKNNYNKVRFYLDQNVIDYLIKGNLDAIQELIHQIHNSEIIYSYVTLREFARIENESQRKFYLAYLKNVNAKYFWIDDNEIAQYEEADPFVKFNELNSANKIYSDLEDSMLGMMHKFLGGKKELSVNDIGISQKNSFSHLIEFINTTLDSLDDNPLIDKESFKNHTKKMSSYYTELIDKSTKQFTETNYISENPLNDLRKLFDINIEKLNQIEPPKVIDQIWEKIELGIKNSNIKLTYDDLFGDGLSKYFPQQKITMVMRVNGLYNILNSIGYYTDKSIRDDKKFIPFINDHRHAGNAIYSDFFVTRDKRLMKKSEAVYEHLKIGTKIIFIQ